MEVKRGEVWWVSLDDSVGFELKTGRPAVVVSSDGLNQQLETVVVAFMTTGSYSAPTHPAVVNPQGTRSRVLCEQIRAVDKSRLIRYDSSLTSEELSRVTGALGAMLCVPHTQAKANPPESNEEVLSLKVELELYRRLYEKTLNQLAELKFEADLGKLKAEKVEGEPVEEEPKEINTCSAEDLKRGGCNPELIKNIINNRPYKTMDDLRRVPGVTQIAYGLLKTKFNCVPVIEKEPEPQEPVDLNTASFGTLRNLGFSNNFVLTIIHNRPYTKVEDLLGLPGVCESLFNTVREKLCVIPVPVEEEPEPEVGEVVEEKQPEPVNINTATAQEISEKLCLPIKDAYAITGYRNKNGLFVCLEELLEVSRISGPKFERIKDWVRIEEPKVEEPPTEEPKEEKVKAEKTILNVNEASIRELMAAGFGKPEAGRIVSWVRKYGPFKNLDELVYVDGVTGKVLRKVREGLTV